MATKETSWLNTLLLIPMLIACGWSAWPSLQTAWRIYNIDSIPLTENSMTMTLDVHTRLLKHGLYVPIEDIMGADEWEALSDREKKAVQKRCGRGRIKVWIPFKIRGPLVGSRVYEWCWTPKIKFS